ncbi:hypothetical protein QR680_004725 [Steinernema hermaphroditum]|uniref:Uncharacterized protein n=1 Tax=Steinernema hermaphroditum TaxID=289476 RepID=A0AA39HRU8_9BILA|nr:hypothetical protein QR680_004725 [Steinernema hermaphroditum]
MSDNRGFVEEEETEAETARATFYVDQPEPAPSRQRFASGNAQSSTSKTHQSQNVSVRHLKSVSDTEIVSHGGDVRASFQKNTLKHIKNKPPTGINMERDDGTQTSTVSGSRRPSIFQTLRERIMHQPVTDFGVGDAKDPADDDKAVSCCCSSWTRFVDTMGNRQTKFCKVLRQLRPCLIDAKLALIKFGAELERELRPGPDNVCTKIADAINEINSIICDSSLNIPPKESSNMRLLTDELAVLLRVCTEVYDHWQLIQGLQHKSSLNAVQTATSGSSPMLETKDGIDAIEKIDKHSLKERITRNVNMIELQLIFIDKKCERRWWLKDLIRVLQAVMKLLLFISAAISVAYHQDQGYPIATLILTIGQGVIDMFDQLFVQRYDPKDINIQNSAKTGRKPVPS